MSEKPNLNRRDFLKISGSALAISALSCSRFLPGSSEQSNQRTGIEPIAADDVQVIPMDTRPNIVVIMVDDLDAGLGTIDHMPNLDEQLISQGLSFEQFFTPTPVCCPSRVTFLTGQYTRNHQVYMNQPPEGSFQKFNLQSGEASTVATWLSAAGYQTGFMGKYMNHYPFPDNKTYVPPGWTEWYSPAKGKPYTGFGYTLNENGALVEYQEDPKHYLTDVLAEKAEAFINSSVEGSNPFFLYLTTFVPHGPYTPAPRHSEDFPDIQAPRTAGFNVDDVSDKPSGIRYDPPLTEEEMLDIDDVHRLRVQSMQAVDEMIEELVSLLEKLNLLDNTYIIFTSDNGYHLGQHRMKPGKAHPYEEDIRVPFIIRGPGISMGDKVADFLTGNIDFAPTIAELAGVIPPDFVDGRSLVPLFGDEKPPLDEWRQAMPIEFYGHEVGESDIVKPWYLGLRTSDYLYVEYEEDFKEFYDLTNDPHQLENIAADVDEELISKLSEWLKEAYPSSGEECRQLENEFIYP